MSGNEDFYEPGPYRDGLLFLWMGLLTAASGALSGGGEAWMMTWRSKLDLGAGELVALGLASVACNAMVGFGCGVSGGLVGQLLGRKLPRWKRYRASFTLSSILLMAFYLAPVAYTMLKSEVPERALTVAVMALMGPVTIWFNAGYWFRRMGIGAGPRLGWRILATALGILLALTSPLATRAPREGIGQGIKTDGPNLILITVDTLRRDHIGAYGALVATPRIDKLAQEGLLFEDVITPIPETAPSHASMFTGRHPAEHRVISNGQPLPMGRHTLATHLATQGYTTGAFVSSFAVDSSSNLDQGFDVYDDDFFPFLRGFSEIQAASILLKVLMRVADPTDFPFLLERSGSDTIEQAMGWARTRETPFFLWVHFFEPHSPYERHDGQHNPVDHREILKQEPGYSYSEAEKSSLKDLYRHEVEYTDTEIGNLLDQLKAAGKLENAVVLLTADHGESLGEHDIHFNHHGIYEEVLQVPLIVWSTDPKWPTPQRLSGQASVMDVANTLIAAAGMTQMTGTHSEQLLNRALGGIPDISSLLLLGRQGMSLTEGTLYGVRSPNQLKYIQSQSGEEEFYDMSLDPHEQSNIASTQPRGVENGRISVASLKNALGAGAKKDVDGSTQAMLEALGYSEATPEPVGSGGCNRP